MHQTIDIWSLGCVFSIAATWVALGYQGIIQFSEIRRSVNRENLRRTNSQSESYGDCFHNGKEVLPEVIAWHKALRIILRKTDTTTSQLLDLVDNHMLLSDPFKRSSAVEICQKLTEIVDNGETKIKNFSTEHVVPPIILTVLQKLDENALEKIPPSLTPKKSSPDSHRRNTKSEWLETHLKKTAQRSQLSTRSPHRASQLSRSEDPTNNGLDYATRSGVLDVNPVPPRSRNKHRRFVDKTIRQARAELDKEASGFSGVMKRFKTKKDKVLSSHFGDRDLVGQVSTCSSAAY